MEQFIAVGSIVPGVKARHLITNTPESLAERKQSGIWFHESEANCNTCANLERVQRAKTRDGFLYGKCKGEAQHEANPYFSRMDCDVMQFHPDDPMHMPCYVSRWKEQK